LVEKLHTRILAAGCRVSAAPGAATRPDTAAYEVFMSRMVRENPNVRRFNTHVALSVLKRGLTIPIRVSDASTLPAAE
jgi:hypothetical protein